MYGPAVAGEVVGIAGAVVCRVAHKIGIVVQCALIDGEELMPWNPGVVRTLQLSVAGGNAAVVDGLLCTCTVVGTAEGAMLLDLLQAVGTVEESPANEVEATSELTAELLRALDVGNLLEQLVLVATEVGKVETGQPGTVANLVDPVDGKDKRFL